MAGLQIIQTNCTRVFIVSLRFCVRSAVFVAWRALLLFLIFEAWNCIDDILYFIWREKRLTVLIKLLLFFIILVRGVLLSILTIWHLIVVIVLPVRTWVRELLLEVTIATISELISKVHLNARVLLLDLVHHLLDVIHDSTYVNAHVYMRVLLWLRSMLIVHPWNVHASNMQSWNSVHKLSLSSISIEICKGKGLGVSMMILMVITSTMESVLLLSRLVLLSSCSSCPKVWGRLLLHILSMLLLLTIIHSVLILDELLVLIV